MQRAFDPAYTVCEGVLLQVPREIQETSNTIATFHNGITFISSLSVKPLPSLP